MTPLLFSCVLLSASATSALWMSRSAAPARLSKPTAGLVGLPQQVPRSVHPHELLGVFSEMAVPGASPPTWDAASLNVPTALAIPTAVSDLRLPPPNPIVARLVHLEAYPVLPGASTELHCFGP